MKSTSALQVASVQEAIEKIGEDRVIILINRALRQVEFNKAYQKENRMIAKTIRTNPGLLERLASLK